MTKSCTRTSSGEPFGRHSRPAFLKSPTNSFFFVSTEISGLPIAPRRRRDQRAQIIEKTRIHIHQGLASATRPTDSLCIRLLAAAQFLERAPNGAARDPGGARYRADPSATARQGLGRRKTPPSALVQHRTERLKPLADGRFINHRAML